MSLSFSNSCLSLPLKWYVWFLPLSLTFTSKASGAVSLKVLDFDYENFNKILESFGIKCELLISGITKKKKEDILQR